MLADYQNGRKTIIPLEKTVWYYDKLAGQCKPINFVLS